MSGISLAGISITIPVVLKGLPYIGTITNPTISITSGTFYPSNLSLANINGTMFWPGDSVEIDNFSIVSNVSGIQVTGKGCKSFFLIGRRCIPVNKDIHYDSLYGTLDNILSNPAYAKLAQQMIRAILDNVSLSYAILIAKILLRDKVGEFFMKYYPQQYIAIKPYANVLVNAYNLQSKIPGWSIDTSFTNTYITPFINTARDLFLNVGGRAMFSYPNGFNFRNSNSQGYNVNIAFGMKALYKFRG